MTAFSLTVMVTASVFTVHMEVTEPESTKLCYVFRSEPELKKARPESRVAFPKTWDPITAYFRIILFIYLFELRIVTQ